MNKSKLPIPLILLIPIVLLVIVIIAGLYRFSLSDEEILAKFPATQQQVDPVVLTVFDVRATNPWTVQVPENKAFAFIDEIDESRAQASGRYDSGAERGVVTVFTDYLLSVDIDGQSYFFAPMSVSNQGSGVFFYLAQFKFDAHRSRVILNDSVYLGDRVKLDELSIEQDHGAVSYFEHSQGQAMADEPQKIITKTFDFDTQRVVAR